MTNDLSPEEAKAQAKALYLRTKGQMSLREIGRLVGRDPAQVSRWKDKGDWDVDLADHGVDSMIGLDLEKAEKVLEEIDWASPDPLEMSEINDIMTVIYKGFLRQLLQKTIYGGINISNFYQADQFMARIEATIRRIQGDPDQTIEHKVTVEQIPGAELDDDAIIQGMKRMKALAENRRRRMLQAGEDTVNIVLIEEDIIEEDIIEGEVVDE